MPARELLLLPSFGVLGLATAIGIYIRRMRIVSAGDIRGQLRRADRVLEQHRAVEHSSVETRRRQPSACQLRRQPGDRSTTFAILDYRTESDFSVAYYDRTFDLDRLDSVDLFASYWSGPAIAHVMLSFGFRDSPPVAISIERRDERGEDYSTVKGLFKQYELFYVVADERDVVRLRTNIRADPPEQVYLYRLRARRDDARRLFLAYLRELNS